jgi:hypothetical protein
MKTYFSSKTIAGSLIVLAVAVIIGFKLSGRLGLTGNAALKAASASNQLVVHEWGTFTSIAGKDGVSLEWRPLNGPTDLPGFVHTVQNRDGGLRSTPSKIDLRGAVRMETPVLYFYSEKEMDVDVSVDFPKGKITEWYPQARTVSTGIDWGRLKVMPGAVFNLPVEDKESHYYPARETDSALLQVCGVVGKPAQHEKFLFYRGVGTFGLPVSVKLETDKLVLQNLGKETISHLIIFENRGGKIGYRLIDGFNGEATIERPTLDRNIESLLYELKVALVGSGLYEKEAAAMIKTWRDSWFEEGVRVFYILPRSATDAVLPLTISPRPADLVRVLIGRAELITPEMEKSVQRQVSRLADSSLAVRDAAQRDLRKYGRFSEPILKRVMEKEKNEIVRERIKNLIEATPATR